MPSNEEAREQLTSSEQEREQTVTVSPATEPAVVVNNPTRKVSQNEDNFRWSAPSLDRTSENQTSGYGTSSYENTCPKRVAAVVEHSDDELSLESLRLTKEGDRTVHRLSLDEEYRLHGFNV
jgi:hypothetical protein